MPEGDTIYRTAETLRGALEGMVIVQHRGEVLNDLGEGTVVVGVESKGKHLLIRFDNGWTLHSHMGMTGSWHRYGKAESWRKPAEQAACALDTAESCVVCFLPKTMELLSERQLLRHPHLSRLGPDLMAADVKVDEAVRRFRMKQSLSVGEAIMDQTLVCGVGNVYKSEVLFMERLNPFVKIGALADDQIVALLMRARKLMIRNRVGYPRTTRTNRQGSRVWVYRRSAHRCFQCDTIIVMRRQGDLGRSTYWCPTCQPVDE